MAGELREIGRSIPLPGSPLGTFTDRVNAELAAGAIPHACPHPGTADWLRLPERILACADCAPALLEAVSGQPPECAVCAAPPTRWAHWTAEHVMVLARLCDACGTTGNTPMSQNLDDDSHDPRTPP
jgi:hypothetical protein